MVVAKPAKGYGKRQKVAAAAAPATGIVTKARKAWFVLTHLCVTKEGTTALWEW